MHMSHFNTNSHPVWIDSSTNTKANCSRRVDPGEDMHMQSCWFSGNSNMRVLSCLQLHVSGDMLANHCKQCVALRSRDQLRL